MTKKTTKTPKKLPETEEVQKLRSLCNELYAFGWKSLTVGYSGSGDSCDDFNVTLKHSDDDKDYPLDDAPEELWPVTFSAGDLDTALMNLLPSGFEDNDGGDGEIRVDITTGDVSVLHNSYYTECNREEYHY